MVMGCAHPAIHKYIEFIRREQNLAANKLVRIRSREKALNTSNNYNAQWRLSKILKNYHNNRISNIPQRYKQSDDTNCCLIRIIAWYESSLDTNSLLSESFVFLPVRNRRLLRIVVHHKIWSENGIRRFFKVFSLVDSKAVHSAGHDFLQRAYSKKN